MQLWPFPAAPFCAVVNIQSRNQMPAVLAVVQLFLLESQQSRYLLDTVLLVSSGCMPKAHAGLLLAFSAATQQQ